MTKRAQTPSNVSAMTTSNTLQSLLAAPTPIDLLRALKELKNAVIGNTWRKVEVAEDEPLLHL